MTVFVTDKDILWKKCLFLICPKPKALVLGRGMKLLCFLKASLKFAISEVPRGPFQNFT